MNNIQELIISLPEKTRFELVMFFTGGSLRQSGAVRAHLRPLLARLQKYFEQFFFSDSRPDVKPEPDLIVASSDPLLNEISGCDPTLNSGRWPGFVIAMRVLTSSAIHNAACLYAFCPDIYKFSTEDGCLTVAHGDLILQQYHHAQSTDDDSN